MIKVVGLGPGSKDALTLGTLDLLKNSKNVYLRTKKHPTVEYLENYGVKFETYDDMYENSSSFDDVYLSIANDLIEKCKTASSDIIYAVPGHPLVAEKSVQLLNKLCKQNGIECKILPAVSFVDAIIESLKIDPVKGLKIIDAFDIKNQVLDKRVGLIITQVYNKYIASEVKLELQNYYNDETEIYFVRAAGIEKMESVRKIKLYELDRQEDIDYLTSIYIEKDLKNTNDFNDLIDMMNTLRSEDGCPWDKEQTHESLKKCLIEECYEVIDAIDNRNEDELIEELGDVLFQIIFHSKLGEEDGFFNINDVINTVYNKMVNRHPHIFGDENLKSANEVLINWDKIKKDEQKLKTNTQVLKHIPSQLPALMKAQKIQSKVEKMNKNFLDINNLDSTIKYIQTKIYKVNNVYKNQNEGNIKEELGNLLFACANVARLLDIDSENALNYTIYQFICTFEDIEKCIIDKKLSINELSAQQISDLWNKFKK